MQAGLLTGLGSRRTSVYTMPLRNVYNVWLLTSDSELVEIQPAGFVMKCPFESALIRTDRGSNKYTVYNVYHARHPEVMFLGPQKWKASIIDAS